MKPRLIQYHLQENKIFRGGNVVHGCKICGYSQSSFNTSVSLRISNRGCCSKPCCKLYLYTKSLLSRVGSN
eukprot:UN08599